MSDIVTLAHQELDKRYNRLVALNASSLCTRCGLCADTCHFYLASGDPEVAPAAKTERVRSVYKRRHDWLSRIFPRFTGARELTEDELDAWVDAAFRHCTMCERCVINCPMGVDTPVVMAAARGTLTAVGKAPEILVQLADAEIARAESLHIFKDMLKEQIGFLEEELREETGDPEASIPMEKEGAEILYVALSGAHTILPAAKIFHRAGANWTLSLFEASNYAVFLGDMKRAKAIAQRIIDEGTRLNVREIVITECGHAVFSYRWSVPVWFGELPFRIRSLVEVIHDYVRDDKIQLDPTANPDPITLHDSCNLSRKSGLAEQPRAVLDAAAADFREMTPNREKAFCCGAGSGLVAVEEWRDTRIAAGQPKAEQIKNTGARVVVTSCDNCRHQISDLGEHFGLDIEVRNLAEVTARALA
ncbi:MAG: (Fe-S)-binding protein [bacterium]|nr:(Fe-S)-binding protein [bacterium]